MKRLAFLCLLMLACVVAHAEESAVTALAGGDGYVGAEVRYDDFAVRAGTFDERGCTRVGACGRCKAWGDVEADLYEGVLYLPIHGPWEGYGTVGIIHRDGRDEA